jgi:hypothetical protein
MTTFNAEQARVAVVRVGEGRGFIVEATREVRGPKLTSRVTSRLVITAAHCLPWFPSSTPMSYVHERTYEALLGPLGGEASIAAECVFADPISDLAVLGAPDGLYDESQGDAYFDLTETVVPLPVGKPAGERAWLLTLDDPEWFECRIDGEAVQLRLRDASKGILGGMSGSPILNDSGQAIAVVSTLTRKVGDTAEDASDACPSVSMALPHWLWHEVK